MKPDMAEAELLAAAPHLLLPIRPQRQWGMTAADRVLPEMRQSPG
jgi:hypothetical protein